MKNITRTPKAVSATILIFSFAIAAVSQSKAADRFIGNRPNEYRPLQNSGRAASNSPEVSKKSSNVSLNELRASATKTHYASQIESPSLATTNSLERLSGVYRAGCGHPSDICGPKPTPSSPSAVVAVPDNIQGVRSWGFDDGKQYLEVYGTLTAGHFILSCTDGSSYAPLGTSYVSNTQVNVVIPADATAWTNRTCVLQKLANWEFVQIDGQTQFLPGKPSNTFTFLLPGIPNKTNRRE